MIIIVVRFGDIRKRVCGNADSQNSDFDPTIQKDPRSKTGGTRARDRVNSVRKKKRSRSSSSSSRKRQVKTKKRKTRRLGAGQSYCTMFTSSAAPNDHSRSAHARARDPRPPLLSSSHHPSNSPPRPSSRYRLLASSAPPIPASPPPLVLREQRRPAIWGG